MSTKNFVSVPRVSTETSNESSAKQDNDTKTSKGIKSAWTNRVTAPIKDDDNSDSDEEPKDDWSELNEPISGPTVEKGVRRWTIADYRELLLLIKDPKLNLDTIAKIMRRKKREVQCYLVHVCMKLLERLGYFEDESSRDAKILDAILAEFRVPYYELLCYKRHKARDEAREKERAEQDESLKVFLDSQAERFVPNFKQKREKPETTDNKDTQEQEIIKHVVNRIEKGTSTLIIGPLFNELLRLAFVGTDIEVICDSINRTEYAVRHKLALLAAKFLEPTDFTGQTLANPIATAATFINDLIVETPDNFRSKYKFAESSLKVMLFSMFRKYITVTELAAARKFNDTCDKSLVKRLKDQQADIAKPVESIKAQSPLVVIGATGATTASGAVGATGATDASGVGATLHNGGRVNTAKPVEDQREVLLEVKSLLQQLIVVMANKK